MSDLAYVLARETEEGGDYVFIGGTQDRAKAAKVRDELPESREALIIYAPSRKAAADVLPQVYEGRKVKGWISAEERREGRAIVKAAVVRAIFCPFTDQVLDMRRAVVVDSGVKVRVMAATHWDKAVASYEGGLPALSAENERRTGHPIKVYDGRELFKR